MGIQSRIEGSRWENTLELLCRSQGILIIKMPLGCKIIVFKNGRPSLCQIKTPFDYTLIDRHGTPCFLDCKSFDSDRISHSQITEHQVNKLYDIEHHNARAGYLVHLRKIDAVVFYDAIDLHELKPGHSLNANEGEYLGPWNNVCLGNLFV